MSSGEFRRATDVLRAVDGLLEVHLQGGAIGTRPLANLAVVMAIDFTGAAWGCLMLDEGDGLYPALTLGDRLPTDATLPMPSQGLLEEARRRLAPAGDEERVAAPIVSEGRMRGVLYLEGGRRPDTRELAGDIATRIGTLLRSGELVEELSLRTENMGMLEALGACLSAGRLTSDHISRALQGAVRATRSREGLLALISPQGDITDLQCLGPRSANLSDLAREVAVVTAKGNEMRATELLGEPSLYRPLRLELAPHAARQPVTQAVGFLAVRRPPSAYRPADQSFFNAVGHLLDGALARVDYFKRAAEDPLTATGSRLALQLKLVEAQAGVRETGQPFSVVLVDVDWFKEINDQHGHRAGDEVLRELGALLTSRLRSEDSVARYGGDEFLVILPHTGGEDAVRLADELRDLVSRRRFGDAGLQVSLSMGVATCGTQDCDVEGVLDRADQALYRSKTDGRDRVTVADA